MTGGRTRGRWKTLPGTYRVMTPERWAEEGVTGAVFSVLAAGIPLSVHVQGDGTLVLHGRGGILPEKLLGLMVAPRVLRGTTEQ
jgi:hypothetical protein